MARTTTPSPSPSPIAIASCFPNPAVSKPPPQHKIHLFLFNHLFPFQTTVSFFSSLHSERGASDPLHLAGHASPRPSPPWPYMAATIKVARVPQN